MKKIVISGSSKIKDSINYWTEYFKNKGYMVLDYPEAIEKEKFIELYPEVFKEFFVNISKADVMFVMNEDKNDIEGYIGAATYAELTFAIAQNLLYNKGIEVILLKMPSIEVSCYDEIKLWLELGWIRLYKEVYGDKDKVK